MAQQKKFEGMVQSCITSVSFPDTIEHMQESIAYSKSLYKESWTDIDCLYHRKHIDGWTVPRWLTSGDIVYFYCTKSGLLKAKNILKKIRSNHDDVYLILIRNLCYLERCAGTIFACAEQYGDAYAGEGSNESFSSRIFAPLRNIFIFSDPLPLEDFSAIKKISQDTITPLHGNEAIGIRSLLLKKGNNLPNYLAESGFGDKGFYSLTADNWLDISCAPSTRFIHESQLRLYFINYLLAGIKDPRTLILEECECRRNGYMTGYTDYMIQIHDRWIPVEAKLSARTERDLSTQLYKYIDIDSFRPTQGLRKHEEFQIDRANGYCIVVDQFGVYITLHRDFMAGCNVTKPLWKRTAFNKNTAGEIREWIRQHVI